MLLISFGFLFFALFFFILFKKSIVIICRYGVRSWNSEWICAFGGGTMHFLRKYYTAACKYAYWLLIISFVCKALDFFYFVTLLFWFFLIPQRNYSAQSKCCVFFGELVIESLISTVFFLLLNKARTVVLRFFLFTRIFARILSIA